MATETLAIHIRPGATPETSIKLIDALVSSGDIFPSTKELLLFSEGIGLGAYLEIKTFLADYFNLLAEEKTYIGLSDAGRAFAQLPEDAQPDILHVLMYTGWSPAKPTHFLPSWAYRQCCDHYWEASSFNLTSTALDTLVNDVISKARETFSDTNTAVNEVSFSRKSLTGVHKWLDALIPPVLTEKQFTRRAFCPPSALTLALGWAIADLQAIEDADILLTPERQERLCRACLLEPSALDRTLDWAAVTYPSIYSAPARPGVFGRTIRLKRRPILQDLVQ